MDSSTSFEVSREKAILIFDRATDKEDPSWIDMMDDFGLYDEETDTWATLYDVFSALGVTRLDIESALASKEEILELG